LPEEGRSRRQQSVRLKRAGRYLGAAVYSPGRMWTQIARAGAPADAAAATLKDDEQVIVVVDSATGELRQCGN